MSVGFPTDSNDSLEGSDVRDDLYEGLGGNDTLIATLGNDTINGGPGSDTLTYAEISGLSQGIVMRDVDLETRPYVQQVSLRGDLQYIYNVEGLIGTVWEDTLRGTVGNDILSGLSRNDTFYDSPGADTYWGGHGSDTVVITRHADDPVIVVNLLLERGWTGDATGDRYIGIENIKMISDAPGASFDVTNTRDDVANRFDGSAGDDIFRLVGGADQVSAIDTVNGGDGQDTVVFGFPLREAEITRTDADTVQVRYVGGNHRDFKTALLRDVEVVRFDDFRDRDLAPLVQEPVITGTNGPDRFYGTNATDSFRGLAGNDTLYGSVGNDTLDGGSGYDLVTFAISGGIQGILMREVNLDDMPYRMELTAFNAADGADQTLIGIEAITATSFDDRFFGTVGRDVQRGLGGTDSFYTSPGADTYDGGAGTKDSVVVRHASEGSFVSLTLGRGYGGEAQGDVYTGIERIYTDDPFGMTDMHFEGDAAANHLQGGGGDDTLRGLNGDDTLVGNGGVDTAIFDYVYDEAIITPRSAGQGISSESGYFVEHSYAGFGFGRDLVTGVEFLQFRNGTYDVVADQFTETGILINGTVGDDTLEATQYLDLMWGFAGNDVMMASAGPDKVDGGAGRDTLQAGNDGAAVHLSLLAGRGWAGETDGDRLIDIEDVFTFGGNDTIAGDHGDNLIVSGGGDDVVTGLAGDDIIDTGFGVDRVVFGFDRDQYSITSRDAFTTEAGISWQVEYIGPGTGDGTNIVTHAEVLQFADGDFIL
ncbi:calcium-binding protein [Tropicibacter sp. R16_0]|uniref:calcium-binding protein n=1 Tax=Tropicibacter sp. R16_0 TaxID=2821102 RepID=UPI001ADA9C84|nr:calcium-binding protein [Tropicibacter sp. R16_0]MBO9452239.1 calcium-binding protein [Tropicibacter sp. R16_0]